MTGQPHHVPEDRLLDQYMAERGGDHVDSAVSAHLHACPVCAARYAEFAGFLDGLRSEADAEIDAWFPDGRLQAARQQIARRLENLGHMARVISFPARRFPVPLRPSLSRPGTRWVAGAAAAGLLVGIALGAYTDRVTSGTAGRLTASRPAGAVSLAPPPSMPAAAEPAPPSFLDEEAFLQEVELASVGLRTRALMPIDAFTPSVREVSAQLR